MYHCFTTTNTPRLVPLTTTGNIHAGINKRMPNKTTTFGNKPSEVEFTRRLLVEFGLPNEKRNEIDRIITRIKVDMKQDELNKKFEEENKK